jgi:hypothetical protein
LGKCQVGKMMEFLYYDSGNVNYAAGEYYYYVAVDVDDGDDDYDDISNFEKGCFLGKSCIETMFVEEMIFDIEVLNRRDLFPFTQSAGSPGAVEDLMRQLENPSLRLICNHPFSMGCEYHEFLEDDRQRSNSSDEQ